MEDTTAVLSPVEPSTISDVSDDSGHDFAAPHGAEHDAGAMEGSLPGAPDDCNSAMPAEESPSPISENASRSSDSDARTTPDANGPRMRARSRGRGVRLVNDPGETLRPVDPIQVIEALLFASDGPISAAKLGEISEVGDVTRVRLLIGELNDRYTMARMAFRIEEIAGGYQMMTLPEYREWIGKLARHRSESRLTDAAMETLSIIAYKQPIIRAEVEAIRGVACGEVLNRLREMGLVKIVGRAEVVGRPMLYGTTKKFLDVFGLASIHDLPPMEALTLRRLQREPAPDDSEPPRAAVGA